MRIEADEFFHRARSVIDHLQERRSPGRSDSGQRPSDHVVDEPRQLIRRDGIGDVRIEDLQEVAELLPLAFFAELFELVEHVCVQLQLVVERHRIQTEIDAERSLFRLAIEMPALHVIETRRAKRPSRRRVNPPAAMNMDVGRIVRSRRRSDVRAVEQPLLDRQLLAGAGRHQHDVHDSLLDHLANLLAILSQRLEPHFPIMPLRRLPRRTDGEAHVGVLRVRDDELFAAARIGMNGGQLAVE